MGGGADQARQAHIQKCGLGDRILAFSPSKWCILMHSGARFRPTRPITAIMMFMTSAEVNFFTFKGGGGQAQGPPKYHYPPWVEGISTTAALRCAVHSGIAVVSRPSVRLPVRLSVTLRYRGRISWVTSKVIICIISLWSSLLVAPTSAI